MCINRSLDLHHTHLQALLARWLEIAGRARMLPLVSAIDVRCCCYVTTSIKVFTVEPQFQN